MLLFYSIAFKKKKKKKNEEKGKKPFFQNWTRNKEVVTILTGDLCFFADDTY